MQLTREAIHFNLGKGKSLQLRAKVGCRPVISVSDSMTWATVCGDEKSRFTLDGILFVGRPMNVEGELAELTIRHSTLLPGSSIGHDCKPDRPSEPSLVLLKTTANVNIEHSIIGSIQVKQDEVDADPICIRLADSILDATDEDEEAIGSDASFVSSRLSHVRTFDRDWLRRGSRHRSGREQYFFRSRHGRTTTARMYAFLLRRSLAS